MSSDDRYASAHASPQGPGDARPTAMQIIEDESLIDGKLQGVTALVTGASSGIGVETARALHAAGAHVVMPVRNRDKGEASVRDITESNAQRARAGELELMDLDLDSLQSVRSFATAFLEKHERLHLLINNAGIMACPESKTADGFERQFGVNHLAHFLLFQLLRPTLLASSTPERAARVVCVSSLGHRQCSVSLEDVNFERREYHQWEAYGQSKTANIWMANEIERRYGAQGLHATSLMPGVIKTNLDKYMDPEMRKRWLEDEALKRLSKSVAQGAATTVWAAVGRAWEGRGGAYLENCTVAPPAPEGKDLTMFDPGYKAYAYDEEGARALWALSARLVGIEE